MEEPNSIMNIGYDLENLTEHEALLFKNVEATLKKLTGPQNDQSLLVKDKEVNSQYVNRPTRTVLVGTEDKSHQIEEATLKKLTGPQNDQSEIISELGEEDEPSEKSPEERSPPLTLELHKNQTPKAIEEMILKAKKTLSDKGKSITQIRVIIDGFTTDVNPALYRPAKKRYAKACEMGLLGLLHSFGFQQEAVTVYATAYCKAAIKNGKVVARGIKTETDRKLFAERMATSLNAYGILVKKHTK